MKTIRWLKIAGIVLIALGLWRPIESLAQSGPPPLPAPPSGVLLNTWRFDDTNWLSGFGGFAPVSFTNLADVADWDDNALQVDSTNPAWLQYNVVENTGHTNLAGGNGTLEFWFIPNWESDDTNLYGSGPGDWGRLIDVGAYTTNASVGWWSLYLNPAGTRLYFSSQTNGVGTNYLDYPISWDWNTWHLITLTYSATNSALYLDGQWATNGGGVVYPPGAGVWSNGFYVGSDVSGVEQAHGQFDDLMTYDYPLDADTIAQYYAEVSPDLPGSFSADDEGPPSPPGGGSSGGIVGSGFVGTPIDYGTNLWIARLGLSAGSLTGIISNSPADVLLEIQSKTNLLQGNWVSQGFVYGSELTNWTPMNLLATNSGNLFLRIRSWADSTGTGIPDWWWLQFFGQITNVDADAADPAGDGYSNLQKFQMGLNPTNYYNPNPPGGFFGCLDASGTNAFLEWSPSPGPVTYFIQRGIQDTNGNYCYSQIGTLNSNATFFEDVGAITNANAQNNIYNLEAVYPGGGLTATDTWEVSWYTDYSGYGPPNGPPMPNNVYAYADVTGTNVLISWAPVQGAAPTNYIVEHGIYDPTNYDYDYYPIASVSTNTTNYEVIGAITNEDNWNDSYGVVAVYPGGGLSLMQGAYYGAPAPVSFVNVGSTNGPAAPGTFYGYADATGTNIFLNWNPAPGAVTHYLILGGTFDWDISIYDYVQIGEVSSNTTSFEVAGGTYDVYSVEAVYADGSLSQAAFWYSGDGAPAPGALSAYVDSTGTNVMLAWTPAQGAPTGYLVQVSDYYGDYYSQIGDVSSNTFSFEDVGGVDNAYYGLDAVVYEVQATYPNGGLSPAVTAMVATNAPAPSDLSATVDSTGTNVLLAWSPAFGVVANYIILRGTYNPSTGNYSYSQVGEVSSNTTSFEDTGALTGGDSDNIVYEVEAAYAGGSLSSPDTSSLTQSSTPPAYNLSVTAQMVRNQTGRWQLMFSGITTNMQAIAFYWYLWDYFYDIGPESSGVPFTTETDIPVSSLTNGIYVIPDFLMTNWFPNNAVGKVAMVQPIGNNNQYGNLIQVGFQPYDSPTFVDGREHMKQNLLFELRAATISQQPIGLSENNIYDDPFWTSLGIPSDTNYVESSIFHDSIMDKGYGYYLGYPGYTEYLKMDDVWPITANYELHGSLYDPSFSGTLFNWQPQSGDYSYNFTFQGSLTIPAAVLGVSDPYWISQGFGNLADVGAYTNGNSLDLQSGIHNLFGLTFAAALVNEGGVDYNYYPYQTYPPITLSPGGSVTVSNSDSFFNPNVFFSQTADPSLELVDYYFAPVLTPGTALPNENTQIQPYPIPALTGFASTNQTPVMITSVGTPTVIGGWAKFAIENGDPTKYAYLGQYYITNAFVVTNGIVSTNTTGVVSPYGDFFPTEPGAVALITLPDIDTGAQGTGVVDVVALNVDANHDGTMDFTYQGPDFVSSSKPYRFWVDDSSDSGDYGGNGIPGQGTQGNDAVQINNQWVIHGRRDLVNLFPVYINIASLFRTNVYGASINPSDTNYQFVLSQADGALRFAYTDLTPTNYLNFLQDTNESGNLAYEPGNPTYATLTTITPNGVTVSNSFLNSIATANGGIILVEAAAPTTQPLVLTIYRGTNQIAQTQLPLSISGVEQMFRFKNLLIGAATNGVNLPTDRLTDADVPNEPDTIDKNVVFVHGYSVSPTDARGWFADIYKRLYWSGSHAKFYGVNWYGNDSQGDFVPGVTANYQTNVVHAFDTAPLLTDFIASLTNGSTVVVAHSLGNMVALSALSDYGAPMSQLFMLDAAVPMEAIDPGTPINTNMVNPTWFPYTNALWASEWFNVWPTNDARNTLTWNGRLDNFRDTEVYNFYSSGEDVLRTFPGMPPSFIGLIFDEIEQDIHTNLGTYVWAWQEKEKGLMPFNSILSSDHGGWGLNENLDSGYVFFVGGLRTNIPPTVITNSVLQTNAFFDMSYDTAMFTNNASGSDYAQDNRDRILSDAIPALTLPIGANDVTNLDVRLGGTANFDMQALENGWPAGRPARQAGVVAAGEWHHSDIRQAAYTFTYRIFNQIVTSGNLK